MNHVKHPITQFRITGIAEGLSYLLLLGWAMPLKYVYKQPLAVQIVGSVHGALFVIFVITIYRAARWGKWSKARMLEAFVASLVPFGTFYLEYKYQREFSSAKDATIQSDDPESSQ